MSRLTVEQRVQLIRLSAWLERPDHNAGMWPSINPDLASEAIRVALSEIDARDYEIFALETKYLALLLSETHESVP